MTPLADALIRSVLVLLAGFAAVFVLRQSLVGAAALDPGRDDRISRPRAAAGVGAAGMAGHRRAGAVGAGVRRGSSRRDSAIRGAAALADAVAAGTLIDALDSGRPDLGGGLRDRSRRLAGCTSSASRASLPVRHASRMPRGSASSRRSAPVRHPAERSRPLDAAPDLLATWGLFRPCILVPPGATRWDDDVIRVVVCHELAHVRRNDWAVQIAADIVRRVYWFQPLMWIACRMLRRESEQACDDVVLGTGVEAPTYAGHLLQLARAGRSSTYGWVAAVPMARPSTLERRIAAMLNSARNRRALSFRALVVSTIALSLATFSAAAFHAEQARSTQLTGTIYDRSGAVLPGVAVTLTGASAAKAEATTDASGRFQLPAAAGVKYVLEASLAGFNAFRQEFELTNTSDWDRAITLQVGRLSETVTVSAKREPATQPMPGAPKPTPVRVGGNIKAPMKLVNVNPVFPASMRTAGRAGVVPLDALIGTDGSVVFVRVVSANVHPDFAEAATEAVRQWKFSPTLLNGKPVEVLMTVTINFALE